MRWLRGLTTPRALARIVAALGLVSVVSALVPAWRDRLDLLVEVVPAVAPAAATAGAAAVGLLLIALARGVRRGKRRAWWLVTVLAAAAVVLHLVKGLDVEEAVLSAAVLTLLVLGRHHFRAAPDPRSGRATLAAAIAVVVAGTALGWLLLTALHNGQVAGTTAGQRLAHSATGLVGVSGPVRFTSAETANEVGVALLVIGTLGLLTVLAVALRPAGGPHPLTPDDELRLRELLGKSGDVDSLSYFALRRDRSALFSPTGKAAVSYRVVGGVSLGAGDPVGDPEAWPGAIRAWLAEAAMYGWIPAVLGASERAATAYAREGLDALELGDEAVVEVAEFGLDGRAMRGVRQAVARTRRAGYRVCCDRLADLPAADVVAVRDAADAWRDGPVERGYSMALGRLGDPSDGRCVLVRAVGAGRRPAGVAALRALGRRAGSPWTSCAGTGRRRTAPSRPWSPVCCAECPRLGVDRVSLNFAVFRSVFARGERLGAGPVLRLWRSVLLQASRFWQIESLYRANAKYRPEWVPRFLCFRRAGELSAVGVAALRAEAFLTAPPWVHRWLTPRSSTQGEEGVSAAVGRASGGATGSGSSSSTTPL